jgi:hypothetical protein
MLARTAICLLALVGLGVTATSALALRPTPIPDADLAILSASASVSHGFASFTIVATNNGPDAAELDVAATQLIGLRFVSEACDFGISPDTPFCEYGTIDPGQMVTTVIQARQSGGRTVSLTSCVSSEQAINDPNPENDCATLRLR